MVFYLYISLTLNSLIVSTFIIFLKKFYIFPSLILFNDAQLEG